MRKRLFNLFLLFLLLIPSFFFATPTSYAATFRNGESVIVDENLSDLYVFGGTVTVDAPVTGDLTTAGGTLNINDSISGGLLAAGGTLNIDGKVGNTIRAAGGTIRITQPVGRDVVVAGGTILLDETASISGDLVVNGGTISIQSPVQGNVIVNGGQVTLNAPVEGNVQGDVGELILGRQAVVQGNLNYSSSQRATKRDGAQVNGKENFHLVQRDQQQREQTKEAVAGFLTAWSIYKLVVDILTCLLLLYLFYTYTVKSIERSHAAPLKMGLLGLATLFLGPVLAFFLLILIFPGIIAFLAYGILILLASFIGNLLVGWFILRWWYGRDNKIYILDWKAAVVGPLVMFLLLFIPFIGWLIGFVVYLIALGGLISMEASLFSSPGEISVRTTRATPAVATRRKR